MTSNEKEAFIVRLQSMFIVVTIILTFAFCSAGCVEKNSQLEQKSVPSALGVEDNTGITSVIRTYFAQNLGQIIAIENYNQVSAQAIVTVTMPAPDTKRVYLNRQDDQWAIERVQSDIYLEDGN